MLKKIFGSRNERLVKRMKKEISAINALEKDMQSLSDEQLAQKTVEFRSRLEQNETLDDLLNEAFAVVREASVRALGLRHYDVQLIGGMVLHQGKISEMRTGEGKTLMATLAAYLNALAGPVHVVTVNDYLASRDAAWMGQVYTFLGLTVGVIVSGQDPETKREAYANDIVYGTNNEYGFDYLRNNMAFSTDQQAQRELSFAIVDEVDSILIDEARTPLIISGPTENSADLYSKVDEMVANLVLQTEEDGPGDFALDEKTKQAHLTEEGHENAEKLLEEQGLLSENGSLYDLASISLLHHINAAIRANHLFHKDVDYVVNQGEVVIIDEFTGRMMSGRRWSDGLHQAVEAKENVEIQRENQTLASITFQNYFRLYDKLSGMTGTADTEAEEFQQIYNLEVVVIPTHKDMIRMDQPDVIYRTMQEKFTAIIEDVKSRHKAGQPVLIGTASIEDSELLAQAFNKAGLKHQVLNAKQHESEAQIIAEAGRSGAITIATNMAGRGTDIVLGGNLEMQLEDIEPESDEAGSIKRIWEEAHQQVLNNGGLYVIGTERHESRRTDNQLRGRSGRQGDPGETRFYLSLEDNLMRIFGSERISGLMQKIGMEEGEAIESSLVSRVIENAQRKVEGHNFDIRKQLLEYDDVANEQRKIVYEERNNLMKDEDVSENIVDMRFDVVNDVISRSIAPESMDEQWDIERLQDDFQKEFALDLPIQQWLDDDKSLHEEPLREKLLESVVAEHEAKMAEHGPEAIHHLEKAVTLQILDTQWKEHLAEMDYLRKGIGLRGYAQKNPKQEYKREAFAMFTAMLDRIKHEVVTILAKVQIQTQEDVAELERQRAAEEQKMEFNHPELAQQQVEQQPGLAEGIAPGPIVGQEGQNPDGPETFVRDGRKIGRNEPCPCGSGKKYKQCHGKLV
ncbi:MAG: preprotein translocase subunit SecA [Arenicella sp.]